MRKTFYLTLMIVIFYSCNKESNYVTFSGQITNKNIDSLIIFHPNTDFTKTIKLKQDGTFKDTLKVEDGLFSMTNNRDFALLYLINGDHITMSFDAEKFEETIRFNGGHALENNFLVASIANENKFFSDADLMFSSKESFDKKVNTYVKKIKNRLDERALDKDFVNFQNEEIVSFKEYVNKEYLEKNYNKLVLGKGKPSPKFFNYENDKGGTISLDDLKGKYVYIDVWATWCPPCKAEIPHLKKLEDEFHDKNISFVSISLDNKKDYKIWKEMVLGKNLGGIQLYAKEDKSFTTAYRVKSIPRFILLDPNGNIIDANAPRPSENRLKEVLKSLHL